MPNKAAKQRKHERRIKNAWLRKYGRTANQVARWKRLHPSQSIETPKNW